MMRHGIEARQGRNRLLAGSVHESPAPKGDAQSQRRWIGNDLTVATVYLHFYGVLNRVSALRDGNHGSTFRNQSCISIEPPQRP